jgi:hypothetical protein
MSNIKKITAFLSPTDVAQKTVSGSEIEPGANAQIVALRDVKAAPTPLANASYRMNKNGEKVVFPPRTMRYRSFSRA